MRFARRLRDLSRGEEARMAKEPARRRPDEEFDRPDEDITGRMPLMEEDGDEFEAIDAIDEDVEQEDR
jgi:hypothetical protein